MSRRHLFDNGFPVTAATLVAGSHVLLAVSRQSMRQSRYRLAMSLLRLADTAQRVRDSLAKEGRGYIALRDSRDNFNYGNAVYPARGRVQASAGSESGELPACEEPHQP
ncbi:MAG: hypothetical protein JOZ85_10225 [Betaproteobacteria bacterium]|nr:hypothetical protein [Betaproteobacteria bacterium]